MRTNCCTRNAALSTQHALSEDELQALIQRCPASQRWAFEGWLRGERTLDGDLIEQPTAKVDR